MDNLDFVTLPNLFGRKKYNTAASLKLLARHITASRFSESAVIQLRIVGTQRFESSLALDGAASAIGSGRARAPDLEIVTSHDAWRAMTSGEASPLVLLAQGKLRVRGNIDLGKRLLLCLRASGTRVDPCERTEHRARD